MASVFLGKCASITVMEATMYLMVAIKKDIEIQPGFKPGSSEFCSDAVSN